jgi:hypothetical protein
MRVIFYVIGVFFAIFFLLNHCSHHVSTTTDQNNPIVLRQHALDQIVLLQPLKLHDAKEYEKLLQTSNAALQPSDVANLVGQSMWWDLRSIIESQADDEGQRLWVKAYLQQLYDAKRIGRCFEISFPLYNKKDPDAIRAMLRPSTQEQSAAALTYILTHHGTYSSIERMQAPEGWSHVAQKLSQRFGDDLNLLNMGETAKDKNRQCDVVIGTFEEVLALDPEPRGRVIRWMLNNHVAVTIF